MLVKVAATGTIGARLTTERERARVPAKEMLVTTVDAEEPIIAGVLVTPPRIVAIATVPLEAKGT